MNKISEKDKLLKIFNRCVDLNIKVFDGIPGEHLIWKPAADSRSIAEIGRHLIRVDNMLLKKINIEPVIEDTFSNERDIIINGFIVQRDYIRSIMNSASGDDEFNRVISNSEGNEISLKSTVIHIIHHHLYHYAQMTYLRRANDRSWESPEKKWEATVDMLAWL